MLQFKESADMPDGSATSARCGGAPFSRCSDYIMSAETCKAFYM